MNTTPAIIAARRAKVEEGMTPISAAGRGGARVSRSPMSAFVGKLRL